MTSLRYLAIKGRHRQIAIRQLGGLPDGSAARFCVAQGSGDHGRIRACPNPLQHRPRATRAHAISGNLAESSDIDRAGAAAKVTPTRAYQTRRAEPEFSRAWQDAIADGYLNLEMEIRRLRNGDLTTGNGAKFDFANAIRLLAGQRDGAARGQAHVRDVSAAEVRASIDRKIEDIRRRVPRQKVTEGKRE